jgi:cell division protease FtsH
MQAKWWRSGFFYLLLLIVVGALVLARVTSGAGPESIDKIGLFIDKVKQEQIDTIQQDGDTLIALKGGAPRYKTGFIGSTEELRQLLESEGVDPGIVAPIVGGIDWGAIGLTVILPIVLLGALFYFLFFRAARGAGTQAFNFSKSRARLTLDKRPDVTFADVAGAEEAKEEVQEVVEFLRSPQKFQALGGRIPRGVLLVGPPGTGKTLLAKAIAGEARVPFYSISGSEFVEMFVGVGAARVRDLFDQAKRNSPCLIFIDEIDAVGRHRGAGLGGGHDEREQTLNQILAEMDGFDTNANVIVMAATNRPDILDPALLRPGRFDRHVVIDLPDIKGRKAILEVHAKGKPLAKEVDFETVAKETPGFSGADLANVINEAAILAARRNRKDISLKEFEEAADRVLAGPEKKSRIISAREKEIIAYHESGHALTARMLPNADPVHKISIVARGILGGWTRFLPAEDRHLWTKSQFDDRLAVSLGGRVAEEITFGEMTTGAQHDLEEATKLARKMVTEYGMSEKLGPRTFGQRQELIFLCREISEQRDYSDKIAQEIDEEVHSIIQRSYSTAKQVLTANKEKLRQLAQELLTRETLDEPDLNRILEGLAPQAAST